MPPRVASVPGHYSIVGLLPEDHTFCKGSLFILAPGTQCVVFDVDGAHANPTHPSLFIMAPGTQCVVFDVDSAHADPAHASPPMRPLCITSLSCCEPGQGHLVKFLPCFCVHALHSFFLRMAKMH